MKYQDLLWNGLNKIISDLVTGGQPTDAVASKSWAWFQSQSGPQYANPNLYVSGMVSGGIATEATFTPTKNWELWSNRMYANFDGATGSVADWLNTEPPKAGADVPTVPPDVITWTRSNLALVGTNKDLLLFGMSKIISDLLALGPTDNTSQKAYEWLDSDKGGASPSEVNAYIAGKLSGTSRREESALPYSVTKNFARWMSAMNSAFNVGPKGSVADWLWLSSAYPDVKSDLPVVPDDVITWTKTALPVFVNEEEGEEKGRIEVKVVKPSHAGR